MFVIKYKLKFEKFVFEYGFKIDHLPTIYMFYNRLRLDFKRDLILHIMKSIKEMFLLTLELALFTFKIRKWCSIFEIYKHYAYECPTIKCSKLRI